MYVSYSKNESWDKKAVGCCGKFGHRSCLWEALPVDTSTMYIIIHWQLCFPVKHIHICMCSDIRHSKYSEYEYDMTISDIY